MELEDTHQLKVLLRFKLDEFFKKKLEFRTTWIEDIKCLCVLNLREGITINCNHYKSAFEEYYKKENAQIFKLATFLLATTLGGKVSDEFIARILKKTGAN